MLASLPPDAESVLAIEEVLRETYRRLVEQEQSQLAAHKGRGTPMSDRIDPEAARRETVRHVLLEHHGDQIYDGLVRCLCGHRSENFSGPMGHAAHVTDNVFAALAEGPALGDQENTDG